VTLPVGVAEALLGAGMAADALAELDDLTRMLGPGVVGALGALMEEGGWDASEIGTRELAAIRPYLGRSYLERHFDEWRAGRPTPGFWRSRAHEGAATGLVTPLGDLSAPRDPVAVAVARALGRAAGPGLPPPRGLLLLSREAHLGNQPGSFAVDLVPSEREAALALDAAEGRHHTVPGSIGEASGRVGGDPPLALLWEVQPNLHKPSAQRSRDARAPWRRYRGWPLATAAAAMVWMRRSGYRCLVLRGAGLAATHEVDPGKPVGPEIVALHDRSLGAAASALGLVLEPLPAREHPAGLPGLAKLRLDEALRGPDADELLWELREELPGAQRPLTATM
jgi:hypothetical protein